MKAIWLALIAACISFGWSTGASAQTCGVTASTIAFASVSPIRNTIVNTTGTLTVSCTWTSAITFNQAQVCMNLTGGMPRTMTNGSNTLKYNLYTDSARTIPWGSAAAGTTPISVQLTRPGTSGTTTQNVTVYAQIPAGQTLVKTVNNSSTVYSESVPAASTSVNYGGYILLLPNCSTLPANGALPFTTNASVINDCNITATNVAFLPNGGPISSALSATGTINVQCTNGDAYNVSLSSGSSGTLANRQMKGPPGNVVNYQLYINPGRTTVWGDGTLSSMTNTGLGSGVNQPFTVYGLVPAQTTPAPGNYSDTITATVSF